MPHDRPEACPYPDNNRADKSSERRETTDMPKYVIERTVPGAGQMDADALAGIASKSNDVLRDLGPDIQWIQSYVSDDKITCVYLAANEDVIREHARCGSFPVDSIAQVRAVIDPATAEGLR
jgi:Protein of unknown function (DUF4242)